MNIKIPDYAEYIINKLINNGYEAYIVGGCVRDAILDKIPNDWDITTNCMPEKVMQIFKDNTIIPTGLKHGTVTILVNNIPVEVTTFRVDGKYSDNRHPDNVKYTNSIVDDLSRRDFTINAMAYNNKEGLVDPFKGLDDISNKVIRCVGHPFDRFEEDALRMLRAIRFSAQLGFNIHKDTRFGIFIKSGLIKNVSSERKTQEVNKILLSDPLKIAVMTDLLLMPYVIPELDICDGFRQGNPYHCYTVLYHSLHATATIENSLHLRLTMLLHDIGKPRCETIDEDGIGHFYGHAEVSANMALDILKRMRYDNYTIMKVRDLILYHECEIQDNKNNVRKWLNKIGEETFRDLLKVKEADIKAQKPKYYQERHDKLERIKVILDEVIQNKDCFSKKDLAINGTNLIQLGYPEGKQIGIILDKLVELVIENPELNTKEILLEKIKDLSL